MKKTIKSVLLGILSIFLLVSCNISSDDNDETSSKFIEKSDRVWGIYFAQDTIDSGKKARILLIDADGNINLTKEKAYPLSSMEYFDNKVYYQNKKGVKELNSKNEQLNLLGKRGTIGYGDSGIIKNKNLYYFLVNEGIKSTGYKSQMIIGDSDSQALSEIDAYIVSSMNTDDKVYLLTREDVKNNLNVEEISINDDKSIDVRKKTIEFESLYEPDNMTIVGDYIYALALNKPIQGDNPSNYYMLKFSKDSLEFISKTLVFENIAYGEGGKYDGTSNEDMFSVGNKVYFALRSGIVYSYDTDTEKIKEEFKLEGYSIDKEDHYDFSYNENSNELSFIYFSKDRAKYQIYVYDLNGNKKHHVEFDEIDEIKGTHVHTLNVFK